MKPPQRLRKGEYAPIPAFKAFLEREAIRLKEELLIPEWSVVFKFVEKVDAYKHIPQEGGYTFEVRVDLVYMQADVSAARKTQEKFVDGDLKSVTDALRHELCHVLTSPAHDFGEDNLPKKYRQKFNDLMENLTETIASIIRLKNFSE